MDDPAPNPDPYGTSPISGGTGGNALRGPVGGGRAGRWWCVGKRGGGDIVESSSPEETICWMCDL